MQKKEIWQAVDTELRRAKKKFPSWPDHIVSRAAIVAEEAGELVQASLQYKYQRKKTKEEQAAQVEKMRAEAVQCIVTGIRFLENLK